MMTTQKQCKLVKINKIYCLVISRIINDYNESDFNEYMNINWFMKDYLALT